MSGVDEPASGAVSARWPSAEAIFEAYLQGDLEAAAITEGWASEHRRAIKHRRATEGASLRQAAAEASE